MKLRMMCAAALLLGTTPAFAASADRAEVALVNDASQVSGCERLAEVKGSSAWGGVVTNMAYNRALSQLKDKAAKAGGNHVLLLNVSSGYAGSNMLGVAYRCAVTTPEAKTQTEPTP